MKEESKNMKPYTFQTEVLGDNGWSVDKDVQYKKSKEPPKCTGLFLLYKWIESLFDHGSIHYSCDNQ